MNIKRLSLFALLLCFHLSMVADEPTTVPQGYNLVWSDALPAQADN